jgi:hypothetical protein
VQLKRSRVPVALKAGVYLVSFLLLGAVLVQSAKLYTNGQWLASNCSLLLHEEVGGIESLSQGRIPPRQIRAF